MRNCGLLANFSPILVWGYVRVAFSRLGQPQENVQLVQGHESVQLTAGPGNQKRLPFVWKIR